MKLKQFISAMLCILLIFSITVCFAEQRKFFYDGAYHEYAGNIFKLKVNGKLLNPPMPPIVFDDYSVVPARAVFEDGLGATVSWEGASQKVTVTMGATKIVMTINQKQAKFNGQTVTMPIAPKIINDYTMIPARFVAEKLGMFVDFDSGTETISINSKQENKKAMVTNVVFTPLSDTSATLTITTNTENPAYNAFTLDNPTRFVLDVTGSFSSVPATINAEMGNISGVRFGQQPEAARVVVDLIENLGYRVERKGKTITVYFNVDLSIAPAVTDIFNEVQYGAEGGRDFVKINLSKGTPVKTDAKVNIPIMGDNLPSESAEKTVTGYFGKQMIYTPGADSSNGTLTIVLKHGDVEMYVEGNEVRFKSIHKPLPRSVTLDAGHGGQDSGAVGYDIYGNIVAREKDFNLDIALRARDLLQAQGVEVHMIRETDTYVDYRRVGSVANDAGSSLFVSIHTNSATIDTAHGIETFGYLGSGNVFNDMTSERLSKLLLDALIEQTGAYNRGVKDGKSLAVINSTRMPATLIEIGFISNPDERAKMMKEDYRQKIAQAVCDAVIRAFREMGI